MDFLFICVSILSLSAVLASISVALRNFALNAYLQPGIEGAKVGNEKYTDILERSFKKSTISGILFIVNTFVGFILIGVYIIWDIHSLHFFWILLPLFGIGMAFFLHCLISGYVQFAMPERPETREAEEEG